MDGSEIIPDVSVKMDMDGDQEQTLTFSSDVGPGAQPT